MPTAARSFASIPRPRHHAVLGHFHEWLGKDNAHKVLETLLAYAERCGGLARIPLGPARMLLLSDPEPIAALLTAGQANVKGWPYVLTRVVLDNVLLLNGEAWAESRAVYRRALRAADAARAAEAALEDFLPRLVPGARLELGAAVQELVADCVAELLCSTRYRRELEPHRARVQYELAAVGIDLQCQPWAYFSPERWIEMRRSVTKMRAFFSEHVDARLAAGPAGREPRDVLSGFLLEADRGEYPRERDALTAGLVNFFFTAHDVLASSVSWCLWLLAEHGDVQDRVRRREEGALARAVRESLRLHPGYPLFSRRTQAPVELAGYEVPAGTDVIVSPWVMHRLERHWPGARRFDPSRWSELEPVRPGPQGAYMPFGGGYRSCIAFALALPLLERLVERILVHARLEASAGHEPDIVYWGSTSSANGLPVTVRATA